MGALSCVEWLARGVFGGKRGAGQVQQSSSLRGAKRRSNPDFLAAHDGLLRCARNDGSSIAHPISINKHDFTISRPDLPEACYRISLPSSRRVQGMPGARCTRGLVCNRRKKIRTRAYRFSGGIRHSLRNGFTAYIALSPAGRARCHRHQRNCFHQLDASIGASGPRDFAVRIRAARQRHIRVHRIPSRACDDRETPLVPGRDQIDILLIWAGRQPKFRKIRN